MSIQDHINLDKMNKIQTTRPMSILDHINMSTHSIKSTQSVPEPKSSILDHISFHEANKLNTCEKPVDEVWIFDDFPRFQDKMIIDHLAKIIHHGSKLSRIVKINVMMMSLCVWMNYFRMIWTHRHLPRRKMNYVVRMLVKMMSFYFLM